MDNSLQLHQVHLAVYEFCLLTCNILFSYLELQHIFSTTFSLKKKTYTKFIGNFSN